MPQSPTYRNDESGRIRREGEINLPPIGAAAPRPIRPTSASVRGGRRTNDELLDELIAAQESGTFVDPMIAAQKMVDRYARERQEGEERQALDTEIANLQAGSSKARVLRQSASLPLAAGSFVPGPVGWGSAALQGLLGLTDPDTGVGEKAMSAGMMALPGALPAMRAFKGGKAALQEGKAAFKGLGSKEMPYRAPSSPAAKPPSPWEKYNVAPKAESKPPSAWRNTEDEMLEGVTPSHLAYLDRQSKAFREGAKQPASMRGLELIDDVPTPQGKVGASEVDDLARSIPPTPLGRTPQAMDDFDVPLEGGEDLIPSMTAGFPAAMARLSSPSKAPRTVWPPKPAIRMPIGGAKTDREMEILMRKAESGRGKLGSSSMHRDLAQMDKDYRRHTEGIRSGR